MILLGCPRSTLSRKVTEILAASASLDASPTNRTSSPCAVLAPTATRDKTTATPTLRIPNIVRSSRQGVLCPAQPPAAEHTIAAGGPSSFFRGPIRAAPPPGVTHSCHTVRNYPAKTLDGRSTIR